MSIPTPFGATQVQAEAASRRGSLPMMEDGRGLDPHALRAPTAFQAVPAAPPVDHPNWCARRDLNSHARRRQFLRLVCIPFHHLRMIWCGSPGSNRHGAGFKPAVSTGWTRAAKWSPVRVLPSLFRLEGPAT